MRRITVNDLVEFKILPFNVYDEDGNVIANAGDNLTPGKLLQMRYVAKLFCEDDPEDAETQSAEKSIEEEFETQSTPLQGHLDIEEEALDKAVNVNSPLREETQLQLKAICKKAYNALNGKIDGESIKQIKFVRDKILDNLLPILDKTHKKSQLKMIGNYEKYHGLNVAMLTVLLAKKMAFTDSQISDITLAALLHDIGKSRLPKEFHTSYSSNSASKANMMYELHPELGYKILKNEMHLSEDICVVALEHHEKNDGTGYPYGVSNDLIHKYSQMVSICNMYDNIISGKTQYNISNSQEAVKKILELGTNWYVPEILYSFVHMTSYHDDVSFDYMNDKGNSNWE